MRKMLFLGVFSLLIVSCEKNNFDRSDDISIENYV